MTNTVLSLLGNLKGLLYIIWLVVSAFIVAINIAERFVPTLHGTVGMARNTAVARIVLKLTDALQDGNLIFGVRHVRNGKDEVPGHSDLINVDFPFKAFGRSSEIEATIAYPKNIGFQYKCYVEYIGRHTYKSVSDLLHASGLFDNISPDEDEDKHRVWFTIKGKPLYTTTDHYINNYFHY
jgi:hypothetical protein